jgi:hypothetical protein
MTGTPGKRDATAATASGSPRRQSNGDGNPSFRLTPTVSAPQCTNTTAPRARAAVNVAATRSSSSAYRCMAGNRQMPRSPDESAASSRCAASAAAGLNMKNPTNRSG